MLDRRNKTGLNVLSLLRTLVLVAALLSLCAPVHPQGSFPVTVTLNISPPYSPYLSDWRSHPERILITLLSHEAPSGRTLSVRLGGVVEGLDNGIRIATKPGHRPNSPILLPPGGAVSLTGQQIEQLFSIGALDITGISVNELLSGSGLPEGRYRICIQAFEFDSETPLSAPAPDGCSSPFDITYLEAPTLIAPQDEETIPESAAQTVLFNWLPPANAPGATRYMLKIVRAPDDRDPNEAFTTETTPLFFEVKLNATTYLYRSSDPALTPGERYAWRVTAEDPTRTVMFRNNGHSEVRTFTYGEEPTELSLTVTPSELYYAPSQLEQSLTLQFRGIGSAEITLDRVAVTLNDGQRIVKGPDDLDLGEEFAGFRIRSFQHTAEARVRYTLSQDELLGLLGTRRQHRFTMRITAMGRIATSNREVSDTEEVDVILTRKEENQFVVTASADEAFPLIYSPAVSQHEIRFEFSTTEAKNIRITGYVATWNFPDNTTETVTDDLSLLGLSISNTAKRKWFSRLTLDQQALEKFFDRFDTDQADVSISYRFEGEDDRGAKYFGIATPEVTLRLSRSASQAFALETVYPAPNDTIPWLPHMLVVGFTPYRDELRGVTYDLELTEVASGRTERNRRTLRWPEGPLRSQGFDRPEDKERARLSIVNVTTDQPPNWVDWAENFKRGNRYTWRVQGDFSVEGGANEVLSMPEAEYVFGMKKPRLGQPADGATLPVQQPITFNWSPVEPEKLLPPDVVAIRRDEPAMFFGLALEQWRLQVATTPDFQDGTIVVEESAELSFSEAREEIEQAFAAKSLTPTHTWQPGTYYWRVQWLEPGTTVPYLSSEVWSFTLSENVIAVQPYKPEMFGTVRGLETDFEVKFSEAVRGEAIHGGTLRVWRMSGMYDDSEAVKRSEPLFERRFSNPHLLEGSDQLLAISNDGESLIFTGENGAFYLWNVTLQVDGATLRANGRPLEQSELTSEDGRFTMSSELAAGDCGYGCEIEAPENRTAASGTAQSFRGRSVRIGLFDLQITEASGSPSNLSGRGTIQVPYLRAPIRVQFENLGINRENVVYTGKAIAESDEPGLIPDDWMKNFSGRFGSDAQSKIEAVHAAASDARRLVSAFTSDQPVALPLGLDRTFGGDRWVIALVGMEWTPTKARLNAVISLPLPDTDERLGLGVRDVCFTPDGVDTRIATMYLVDDRVYQAGGYTVRVKALTEAPPDSGTYVSWDCDGFKEFRLSMEHEFPRSWLIPVSATGTPLEGPAKARFKVTVRRKGDWIASGSLDPSMFAAAPEFWIEAREVSYDHSSVRNPEGMQFPSGYTGPRDNTWTGFYINRLAFHLPEQFRKFGSGAGDLQAFVEHMLIDGTGLSLSAGLENLLDLRGDNAGNLGGWAYSIERLSVQFVSSSLREGSLNGQVLLPISDTPLAYQAVISRASTRSESNGESASGARGATGGEAPTTLVYEFNIRPENTLNVPLWVAEMQLEPTSAIRAGTQESLQGQGQQGGGTARFMVSATLNGAININTDAGGIPLSFRGVKFENVWIGSDDPYFQKGTWSFASPQHYLGGEPENWSEPLPPEPPEPQQASGESAGFPITISNVDLVTESGGEGAVRAGLRFDFGIQLPADFEASTDLTLWGRLTLPSADRPMAARFDDVVLNAVCIGGTVAGVVSIDEGSCIEFYRNDPTYGNGFGAEIEATFLEAVRVGVEVKFGKVDGFDYWYVEGLATIPSGVPMVGVIAAYGFGGGAYYHVRQSGLPGAAQVRSAGERPTYVPDRGAGLGLKATVIIGTYPQADAFNADVTLEVSFTARGGLREIRLDGDGYLITNVNSRPENPPVSAFVRIYYNFPDRVFDGTFGVQLNLAGVIEGGGDAQLHIERETWFFRVGEPTPVEKRFSVKLAWLLEVNAYLAMGSEPPDIPPPPPEAPSVPRQYNLRDIGSAQGFIFGASARFDYSGKYLILKAELGVGMGFDLAFINFGEDARCAGDDGGGYQPGINGWYAFGQLYAWGYASIAVGVDLWFVEGWFTIFEAGFGATLTGGLPKPTWVEGAVEGEASFAGIIEGRFRFEFRVGEKCEPLPENPLEKIDLITDFQPADGSKYISVFADPAAAFQWALERPFDLRDDAGKVRTFRLKVRRMVLRQESANGPLVPGRTVPNGDRSALAFEPTNALQPQTWYWASIAVYGEERIGGRWEPARTRAGEIIEQVRAARFKTGNFPRQIQPGDVAWSYPLNRQRYFLPGESRRGVIALTEDYGALKQPRYGNRVSFLVRFTPLPSGTPIDAPATLASSGREFTFTIPSLQTGTTYIMQLIRRESTQRPAQSLAEGARPTGRRGNIGERQQRRQREQIVQREFTARVQERLKAVGAGLMLKTRQLPGVILRNPDERLLYPPFYFRTSRYRTFAEKMAAVRLQNVSTFGFAYTLEPLVDIPAGFDGLHLSSGNYENRGFDVFELEGVAYRAGPFNEPQRLPPLIRFSTRWSSNWAQSEAEPWIYQPLDELKRLGLFRGETWRESLETDYLNADYRPDLPLSDAEVLHDAQGGAEVSESALRYWSQATGSGWGAFFAMVVEAIYYGTSAPMKIMFGHGLQASRDHKVLRETLARHFFLRTVWQIRGEHLRLRQAYQRPYQPPTAGRYAIDFYYQPPRRISRFFPVRRLIQKYFSFNPFSVWPPPRSVFLLR